MSSHQDSGLKTHMKESGDSHRIFVDDSSQTDPDRSWRTRQYEREETAMESEIIEDEENQSGLDFQANESELEENPSDSPDASESSCNSDDQGPPRTKAKISSKCFTCCKPH